MKLITSKDNADYKRAISLRQKKHRQHHDLFLVEGVRAIMTGLQKNIMPVEVWIDERMENRYKETLSLVDIGSIRLVRSEMFDRLTQTQEAQGVLAVFSTASLPRSVSEFMQDTIVVLDRVQDPGNAGTIVRSAAAAGCRAVWTTFGSVDIWNEKAVRSTMGSLFQIPVRTNVSIDDIAITAAQENRSIYVATIKNSMPYTETKPMTRTFWVFGNEGNGVSESMLGVANACYHIPLNNNVESLNVATAASVILFHYRNLIC